MTLNGEAQNQSEIAGIPVPAHLRRIGSQTVSKVEVAIVWHLTKDKAASNSPTANVCEKLPGQRQSGKTIPLPFYI